MPSCLAKHRVPPGACRSLRGKSKETATGLSDLPASIRFCSSRSRPSWPWHCCTPHCSPDLPAVLLMLEPFAADPVRLPLTQAERGTELSTRDCEPLGSVPLSRRYAGSAAAADPGAGAAGALSECCQGFVQVVRLPCLQGTPLDQAPVVDAVNLPDREGRGGNEKNSTGERQCTVVGMLLAVRLSTEWAS